MPPEMPAADAPAMPAIAAIATIVSIAGSQATMRLAPAANEAHPLTVGSFVAVRGRDALVIAVVCDVALDAGGGAQATLDLLGEIAVGASGARFRRGVSRYPTLGSDVVPISAQVLRLIFENAGPGAIEVGRLYQDSTIGAYVDPEAMVRKHFAVLGSTGAGKSSAVAVLLRDLMAARPDLRMLLIDPHNEYGSCFGERAYVMRPGLLRLPYWLFTFDELIDVVFGRESDLRDEISLLGELIPVAKNLFARGGSTLVAADPGRFTVDTPVPYRMDDLLTLAHGRMGKLENSAVAGRYQRLIIRLDTVRRNPRYAFIFDDDHAGADTMVEILCELFRLDQDGKPVTVVQLAGFPTEIFDALVSVLFRLAFEFGLWSDGALPLLIVCEEAHRYANADRAYGFRPARQALSRIAKEGRKYGVFLGLVTQRPAELDPPLLSQCSTVFAMRMANEADQAIVRAAVADPGNRLLGFLSSLGTREAVAFGAGVPAALRLAFKELPPDAIPKSEAVWGGRFDAAATLDRPFVQAVVSRWRGIAAENRPPRAAAAARDSIFLLR